MTMLQKLSDAVGMEDMTARQAYTGLGPQLTRVANAAELCVCSAERHLGLILGLSLDNAVVVDAR